MIDFEFIIRTLTPLHIGNGEWLTSKGEFITTTDHVRFIKQNDLHNFLKQKDQLNDYSYKILVTTERFDTFKILMDFGVDVDQFIQRELILNAKDYNPLNNYLLYLFINDNKSRYIPGSSIKGVFKTAFLFHKLKTEGDFINSLEHTVLQDFEGWNDRQVDIWLGNYWSESEKKDEIFIKKEFNFLRPFDTHPILDNDLSVEQVRRQHFYGVKTQGPDWLLETIRSGVDISFKLQILPSFNFEFSDLNTGNHRSIFRILNNYTIKVIEFEMKLIEKSEFDKKQILIDFLNNLLIEISHSEDDFCICRLGKGKTIYFQTILSLLKREVLDIIIQRISRHEAEIWNFPKTRVLTANDIMLGWIRIVTRQPELVDNQIGEIIVKETVIQVNFINQKLVSFKINGFLHENVQLVNPLKKTFNRLQVISVTIWQLSSKGINQVKLEEYDAD